MNIEQHIKEAIAAEKREAQQHREKLHLIFSDLSFAVLLFQLNARQIG